MDDEHRDGEQEPTAPNLGRVRIVGAEPAGSIVGEPAGGVAGAGGGEEGSPPAEVDQGGEPFGQEVAGTDLPHWTEAPTGEVPAVLQRADEPDDADPWSAMPAPTWREGDTDWEAQEETFEPSMLAHDDERHGSLDESSEPGERQPWSFDLSGAEPSAPDGAGLFGDEPADDDTVVIPAVRPHQVPGEVAFSFEEVAATVSSASLEDEAVEAEAPDGADPSATPTGAPGAARPPVRRGLGRHGLRLSGLRDGGEAGPTEPAGEEGEAGETVDDDDGPDGPDGPEVLVARAKLPHRPGRGRRSPAPRVRHVPVVEGRQPGNGADVPWPRPGSGRPAPVAHDGRSDRNLPVAVASGLALGIAVLVFFKLGTVASMVIVTAALTVAAMEVFAAFRRAGYHPVTLLGLVATVSLLIATYQKGQEALPLVLVLLFAFTMLWQLAGVDRAAEPVRSTAVTLFAFGWIAVFGSFAALLLNPTLFPNRHGIAFLLGAVIAAVGYDVGALAVGRWAGRHPLSAASPNKTWEGVVGGGVVAVLASVVVVHLIHPWTLGSAAALGLVVAVVSPIGDLSESLVKRHLGLKDMGRLLPGHGGLVDRIDGLLFVMPATYYLVKAFHLG